ncbi:hypothetical protein GOBAR_AA04520 [Gossypium barbadense]|uniref:Uncharacterized protein n=1 Tax=Gossypium barbadense TaxID=3634 RepID=A0A2P5YKG1_GOSBA|nr:hypothetical protein GOBAR_AA04520 [Gossypium barbadense]
MDTYEDPTIRAVIPDELFVNPNTRHVKVPLVVYATIEMHKAGRVLWKFGFRQSILVAPQKLNDLHRIDLRWPDENWIHGKPYLYGKEVRRRPPLNSRVGEFSSSSPMSGWTIGHLNSMFYMSGPYYFPIMLTPMMMYRPSTCQELTDSPLIIPSVYGLNIVMLIHYL